LNYISIRFTVFLVVTLTLYFLVPNRYRWAVLLVASYVFYMSAGPAYGAIIFCTSLVSYLCGLKMGSGRARGQKTPYLLIAIIVDVGVLLFFKYFDFFSANLGRLVHQLNVGGSLPELKLLVPLGISFYTLQTLSYIFDVYRGDIEPERHFGYLALYVAFFPTLIAGPIERGKHLLPQLNREHEFSYADTTDGLRLIAWGLFKKVVVADRIAIYVNAVYTDVRSYTGLPLILATILFAFQLYYDFSGYTDIARGVARLFGYDLLINFNLPYLSKSIVEFWRRWHMSMTSWFRDYVYIPLGGNRVSKPRAYLNIAIVFLVSGFWHGAGWTFIVWGGLHGLYMITSRATEGIRGKAVSHLPFDPKGLFAAVYRTALTFILVDFAWIFFRSSSLREATYVVTHMFSFGKTSGLSQLVRLPLGSNELEFAICLALLFAMFGIEIAASRRPLGERLKERGLGVRWAFYVVLVMSVLLFGVMGSPQFFYARF
jgi:alginate O-acetyltransferase complex protein AlgI